MKYQVEREAKAAIGLAVVLCSRAAATRSAVDRRVYLTAAGAMIDHARFLEDDN